MTLHEKLVAIQSELKAPKSQQNTFGKYKYRSCEDILEAVKPLLKQQDLVLTLCDEIVEVGGRVYVKATAQLTDAAAVKPPLEVCAFARESLDKKGMDDAQITGSASSYARKYALNGLFCIDDTKDSDATNTHDTEPKKTRRTSEQIQADVAKVEERVNTPATPEQLQKLRELCNELKIDRQKFAASHGVINGFVSAENAKVMIDELEKELSKKLDTQS